VHLADGRRETTENQHRIVESSSIGRVLEIEVLRRPPARCDELPRERGLADLAGAENRGDAVVGDEVGQCPQVPPPFQHGQSVS